jgi:hypothetical protein
LHMFAMATHVFSSFLGAFSCVSDISCERFSYFGRMLQVFHLDVAKVDWVLHMLQWDPSTIVVEAPPWVTVRTPEAGRHICGVTSTSGGR